MPDGRGFWIPTLILLLALAALAGALVARAAARQWMRLRMARIRRQGRHGERRAPAVLAAAGYRVLQEQPEREAHLAVDGQRRPYRVRADFLAGRGSGPRERRYVVEVKTGRRAPDPCHAATRRQLLEYQVLYRADGVLLLDMEAGWLHRITWPDLARDPGRRPARRDCRWLWALGAGFALGFGAGLLVALG
jgi:hypothetical protein